MGLQSQSTQTEGQLLARLLLAGGGPTSRSAFARNSHALSLTGRLRSRESPFPAERDCRSVLSILWGRFLDLAGRDLHHVHGVGDHIGGALVAFRGSWHAYR